MSITYVIILAAILNFFIGLFVWRSDYKKPLNIYFALMSFFISVWVFLNFLLYQYQTIFLLKSTLAISPYLIIAAFLWVYLLINNKFSKKFLVFIYVLLFFSLFVSFLIYHNPEIIKSMANSSNVQVGKIYYLYSFYMISSLVIFILYLLISFVKANTVIKKQLEYVIIGLIVFILIVVSVSLILPVLGYTQFSMLDSPSSIILVAFTALAISKRHLFNIRVIATETLVVLIVLVLLIQTLISKTWTEGLTRGGFLLLVAYFGYLLIKSVINEIERRKQIEKLTRELEQANLHLQELDKMKSEFVSIASHDLLTPVAAIEGYLSMILDEEIVPIKNHKLKEYLERVYGSSKRLARLISDLLNISRIEEGRLLIERQEYDIIEIVESAVQELAMQVDKHHLYLRFNKPTEKIPKIYADAGHIKEVLINLVGNAIKFTKTGGVTIELEMLSKKEIENRVAKLEQSAYHQAKKTDEMFSRISKEKNRDIIGDKQIVIHVKDTGIGISEKELPSLFQKFYRGAGWTVANIQGAGLGLYISKSLVELNNGRIWINQSDPGKGSDFSFSIPFSEYIDEIKKRKKGKIEKVQLKPLAKGPKREF